MTVYVERQASSGQWNEWAEGAWEEVLRAFGAKPYTGEPVEAVVMVQPENGKFQQGRDSLKGFSHPDGDTLYVFGPDSGHRQDAPEGLTHSIHIPQVASHVTLWSHQAAAVVLWDRVCKDGTG